MSWALVITGGSMALTVFGSSQQRKEIEKQADEQERKIREQMGIQRAIASGQAHDIKREVNYASGAAKAGKAGSGTAVGTGSNISQVDNIAAMGRRKIEKIMEKVGFGDVAAVGDIKNIKRQEKGARRASYWSQGSQMLSQGYQYGMMTGMFEGDGDGTDDIFGSYGPSANIYS